MCWVHWKGFNNFYFTPLRWTSLNAWCAGEARQACQAGQAEQSSHHASKPQSTTWHNPVSSFFLTQHDCSRIRMPQMVWHCICLWSCAGWSKWAETIGNVRQTGIAQMESFMSVKLEEFKGGRRPRLYKLELPKQGFSHCCSFGANSFALQFLSSTEKDLITS